MPGTGPCTAASTENAEHTKPSDSEKIGGYTGLGAGILTGAKIGTVVIPVAGLGTFAGAVVGGVVGNEVGKRIGRSLVSGASAFTKTFKDGK